MSFTIPPPTPASGRPRCWPTSAALLGLSLAACVPNPSSPGSADDPLSVQPVELGKGVLLGASPGSSVARGPCVDFVPRLASRPTLQVRSVAISATSSTELTDKLNVTLGGDIPISGVKTKLTAAFQDRYGKKEEI